jgi:hypothetical protein
VAWKSPPAPPLLDSVDELVDIAPSGVRLPSEAEINVLKQQGVALREVSFENWRSDLEPLLKG